MAGELISQLSPDVMVAMVENARMHAETVPMMLGMDGSTTPQKALGPAIKIASVVGIAAAVLGTSIKSFDTVPENYYGLRSKGDRLRAIAEGEGREWFTRKKPGELYGLVMPGPHVHRPIIGGIRQISAQRYISEIKPFHITTDEQKRQVEAELTWGVMRHDSPNLPADIPHAEIVYNAIAGAKDREEMAQGVSAMAREGLRHIMQEKVDPERVTGEEVSAELIALCGGVLLDRYGVEMYAVNLGDVAATEAATLADAMAKNPYGSGLLGAAAVTVPDLMPGLRFAEGA